MKISVIMLTYNRENLVASAIESIIVQTFNDFEFIIIDNGSTDKSGEISENFAKKDSRIKVVHIPQSNIGTGRNKGLDLAKGEYITFIDDDDFAELDMLEFLYNLAINNDADITICGAADKVYDEKLIMTPEKAIIELMWRKRYNAAFPTKFFKRNMMETLRFPEDGKFDDISMMYKLLANATVVAYHGLPKYTFYRHAGNNSAWTTNHSLLTSKILEEYLNVYRERTEWLNERFPNSSSVFRYFEWSFIISMVDKVERYNIQECQELLFRMKRELQINCKEFLECNYIQQFERNWMKQYIQLT